MNFHIILPHFCSLFQSGPMVPGLAPKEASDRLLIYQNQFDNLFRKYQTYTGGEELFGLQVSEYPELLQVKIISSDGLQSKIELQSHD